MIKSAFGLLVLLEVAIIYLFMQAEPSMTPAAPVNPVYAFLLALLNVLIIGIGVMTFKSSEKLTALLHNHNDHITTILHKMDKRLVKVETKLKIENTIED